MAGRLLWIKVCVSGNSLEITHELFLIYSMVLRVYVSLCMTEQFFKENLTLGKGDQKWSKMAPKGYFDYFEKCLK